MSIRKAKRGELVYIAGSLVEAGTVAGRCPVVPGLVEALVAVAATPVVLVVVALHRRRGLALVLLGLALLVVAEVVEDGRGVTVRVQDFQYLTSKSEW